MFVPLSFLCSYLYVLYMHTFICIVYTVSLYVIIYIPVLSYIYVFIHFSYGVHAYICTHTHRRSTTRQRWWDTTSTLVSGQTAALGVAGLWCSFTFPGWGRRRKAYSSVRIYPTNCHQGGVYDEELPHQSWTYSRCSHWDITEWSSDMSPWLTSFTSKCHL